MILRQLILFATWCAAATACFAEWEIVSVSTEPFSRESGTGPPELRLHLSLRNASDREILVMGQQFPAGRPFYLIEAFIQNAENAVWERKSTAMCGSFGEMGWITVRSGETIQKEFVLFRRNVGQHLILTFRRAYSRGDNKGSEILLGPLKIPEPGVDG